MTGKDGAVIQLSPDLPVRETHVLLLGGNGNQWLGLYNLTMEEPTTLPPRYRMWLWIWGTLLVTPCAIGLLFTVARVTAVPLIIAFAPCMLLAQLAPADSRLLVAYILMPLQCFLYGGVLARSEIVGRTRRTLLWLLVLHAILAIAALAITGGRI